MNEDKRKDNSDKMVGGRVFGKLVQKDEGEKNDEIKEKALLTKNG